MKKFFLFLIAMLCLSGFAKTNRKEAVQEVDGCQYQPHQVCYNFIIHEDGITELENNIGVNIYDVAPDE